MFDVVLTKSFPNQSLNSISISRAWNLLFACDYPKSGIILGVVSKKYFEAIIRNILFTNNMIKTIRM
jgi:hypothetical protein